MSMWTLSRNWRCFLMGVTLQGFVIVAKEPMVDGSIPEFTKLAFVAAVRWFWFLNYLHPKMMCRFKDLNWVIFSHCAGVNAGGIGGRLLVSLWTRLRVQTESGLTDLLWSIASLGSLALISIRGWGWFALFNDGNKEVWDKIDSS